MVDYETSTPRLPRINIDYAGSDSTFTNTVLSNRHDQGAYITELYSIPSNKGNGNSKPSPVVLYDTKQKDPNDNLLGYRGREDRLMSVHSSINSGRRLSELSDDKQSSVFTVASKYSNDTPQPKAKSARFCERALSCSIPPMSQSAKCSSRTRRSLTERSVTMSSYRLRSADSDSSSDEENCRQSSRGKEKRKWRPPHIPQAHYQHLKDKLLEEGKFKPQLIKYFRMEPKWWNEKEDSEDDGYDTDLDKQLGFELIADEKSREILEDGVYPEYKQECRKFRSNPNTYFLHHCLDDNLRMRHRYLSKGDSITISNHIKNHLTTNTIDLADNGIGPRGMKYFKNVLHTNKHLTVLNLASNNLGAAGAKYLRSSLSSNCFLQRLDVSDNKFGEKGCKYISNIIEENVNLMELNIANNAIGDKGAEMMSQALAKNISLKILDISWNHISSKGALKIADSIKTNMELEVLLAAMNGFGEEGGKAMVQVLRNTEMQILDLSNNRITDAVVKTLTSSLDGINLKMIKLGHNNISSKSALDLLTGILASTPYELSYVHLEGVHVTDELKGLAHALHIVHNINVVLTEIPSKRETTHDVLTKNLVTLCEFMEEEELEVEDLFPDYEDLEGTKEGQLMVTVTEVICALEVNGRVRQEKIRKLASRLKNGTERKFQISEFALVYDQVICGKDPYREMPLRTHLRRSIKEERAEKERKEKMKAKRSYSSSIPPPTR